MGVVMAVMATSGRSDHIVSQWVRMAESDSVTFEALMYVPRKLVTLSQKMSVGLTEVCRGALHSTITTKGMNQFSHCGLPLSGTQVYRLILRQYQTQPSLELSMRLSDISRMTWAGDSLPQVEHTLKNVMQYHAEFGHNWDPAYKRDFLAGMMKETRDPTLAHDLATFHQDAPMNFRGPGPKHSFEFLIERLEGFVQRRRWEANDASRTAEWARMRAAPSGSGGARGAAAVSNGGSDRTAADEPDAGATAAPAVTETPRKEKEPLNLLVAPLRATEGPNKKRFCLFYICDKCKSGDKCDWWHPGPEERTFTTEEVDAALDFCGRPRDYTRARSRSTGKRGESK